MKFNFKKAATRTLGVGAGAAGSRMLGNNVAKNMKPVLKGAAAIALGALVIPTLVKGDMGENVGDGFIAEGTLRILESKMPDKFAVTGTGDSNLGATRDYVLDESYTMHGDDEMSGMGDSGLGGISEDQLGALSEDQIGEFND